MFQLGFDPDNRFREVVFEHECFKVHKSKYIRVQLNVNVQEAKSQTAAFAAVMCANCATNDAIELKPEIARHKCNNMCHIVALECTFLATLVQKKFLW